MGTDNSTEELKVYPTVLVWVLSAATVSRYKAIKVIIRGLGFGITCVKATSFGQKRLKTSRRHFSRAQAVATRVGTVEGTLPRAGYPPVPEAGEVVHFGPT